MKIKKQTIKIVIFSALLTVFFQPNAYGQKEEICRYKSEDKSVKSWAYPVGTELKGICQIDIDGDRNNDELRIVAKIERDYAVDVMTAKQSANKYCWFNTMLEIRNYKKEIIYQHHWSIKFEDMYTLLAIANISNPKEYFAKFATISGLGMYPVMSSELAPQRDTMLWSLESQGIEKYKLDDLIKEISGLWIVRGFIYNASWHEDRFLIIYVPSIKRVIAVRSGIPILE
jgi:hypothetical protein